MATQDSTQIVEKYLEDYSAKHAAFKQVAEYVEDVCRSELQSGAIMSNVSSRAKDPDRYREKLKKMRIESKSEFTSTNDLEDKIMDIIGVRVIVYFPSQIQEVVTKLETLFSGVKSDVEVKSIVDAAKPPSGQQLLSVFAKDKIFLSMNSAVTVVPEVQNYESKYGKYRAVHLRFELKNDTLGTILQQALGGRRLKVEIQVQSLLLHAWSEVNHDLAYKTLNGEVSQKETYLLDLLNGIGKMGELVLQHVKGALDYRLKQGTPKDEFSSVHELAECIRSKIDPATRSPQPCTLGDVEDLRDFLIWTKRNNRAFVEGELTKLQKNLRSDSPIVNGLLGRILELDTLKQSEEFSKSTLFLVEEQRKTLSAISSEKEKALFFQSDVLLKEGNKAILEKNETKKAELQEKRKAYDRQKASLENESSELLAKILDMTLRPYIQAVDDGLSDNIVNDFKLLRDGEKLYLNTLPIGPREAYKVNQEVLARPTARAKIETLAKALDTRAKQVPLLQYYLRLARIRAWRNFARKIR